MKILILGATGLLGHRLFIELSKHHEVWGTYRSEDRPLIGDKKQWIWLFDELDSLPVLDVFGGALDVVINCVAAIPQRNPDITEMIHANALFPNQLAKICKNIYNARLIHFSTDAVFSGKHGDYTEDDEPDANDVYGLTKRLGEISDQEHVLTLRCCPIGRELNGAHSLVEWFLAQTGEVRGYTKAMFTPMTTHNIANILNKSILEKDSLYGLYHLSGAAVSKYDMLIALKEMYSHHVEIIPDDSVKVDRTLDNSKLRKRIDFNWSIYDMAADNALYEGVHAHI